MRQFDFSPLYRSTVGFDRLFSALDQVAGYDGSATTYPPYNIERTSDNTYRVSVAVAGFAESEIAIEVKENALTIRGEKSENKEEKKGEILHQGKFLTLKLDTVELPDGKHATREFVEHPGAVMILPLFDDGRVLLERQYRYPIAKVLLEFPAGKLDPNESELACAKRELQEETGYTAREWFFLTRIHPVISYSTEFIDLYLARGLTAGESKLDEGEFLETLIAEIGRAHV